MTIALEDDRDPRWIPGAAGYADDIRKRVAAYADAEPDGPPSRWTPEYAAARFAAAVKAGGRWHGPQALATCWPPMLVEFADLVDAGVRANVERDKTIEYDELDAEPDPDARLMTPTLAEEALRWPMLYLRDHEREAACLLIWAKARAKLLRIEPFLHKARMAHLNHRARGGEALNDAEAFELDRWQRNLAARSQYERDQHAAMVARFAGGCFVPTAKTSLHRWRKSATAIICARLEADGVRVR